VPPTDIDWEGVPGMSVEADAVVDTRTGEVTPLPAGITAFRKPGGYAVAPGGAVLFFEASPDGSRREQIFVANVDGTNLRQLTDALGGADAGGWSPDGTTIVARIWGPEGPGMDGGQVVLIDVATGETTLLADGPDLDFFEPHFDADGQQVLFTRYGRKGYEVFGVPVDGGEVGLVFEDRWAPIFSPDGRTMIYGVDAPIMRGRTGNPGQELWLADADGSDPRPLVWEDAFNDSPSWSPDGTKIAYARSRFDESDGRVVIVGVPNGEPTYSVLSPGSWVSAVWLDDHRLLVDVGV
jgi:Tol biopolymer transport system component